MDMKFLLVGLFILVLSQKAFAQSQYSQEAFTVGKLLNEYWNQPKNIRDEIRHVFINLGVDEFYLEGDYIGLTCHRVLTSRIPNITTEHFNMTSQQVHRLTAFVLKFIYQAGATTMDDAMFRGAHALIKGGHENMLAHLREKSIFHSLKSRIEVDGVIQPLYFPLELYRYDLHDPASTSLTAGVNPAIEELIFAATDSANEKLWIFDKSSKIYVLLKGAYCKKNECELIVSVLNAKGFRNDMSIRYKADDQNKVESIANDLVEVAKLILSL